MKDMSESCSFVILTNDWRKGFIHGRREYIYNTGIHVRSRYILTDDKNQTKKEKSK